VLAVDEEPVEPLAAQYLGDVWVAQFDEDADAVLAPPDLLLEQVLYKVSNEILLFDIYQCLRKLVEQGIYWLEPDQ
jgi:hypothetical protein